MLVRVRDVWKAFPGRMHGSIVHAVNGVSLEVNPGQTLAVIGESGSGKSTLGRLVLGLHRPDAGLIEFQGKELSALRPRALQSLRSDMTVVFQEPYASLDPRMSIEQTVQEPLVIHRKAISRKERDTFVDEALERVALAPRVYRKRYPHELSGGQQQRAGIARAIVTRPKFIVLDEPTSSLDLSVRAHILELLQALQEDLNLAYLFISHDISTIRYISQRVAVMYFGKIVEVGPTADVFNEPQHPYTRALLSSALSADPAVRPEPVPLQGEIPSPTALPKGCVLYGRCPVSIADCANRPIELVQVNSEHEVACIWAAPEPDNVGGTSNEDTSA